MKEAYYFSHDANARNDPKILAMRSEYGVEGYGRFWILIEMLREQSDYKLKLTQYTCKALALQMQCNPHDAEQFLQDCIDEFELFSTDGTYFWSESLMRRMAEKDKKSKQARKAAMARWNKEKDDEDPQEKNADAKHSQCDSNAIKERKGKDIDNNTCSNSESPNDSEKEDQEPEEKEPKFDRESTPYKAACHLIDCILENNKRANVPEKDPLDSQMERWCIALDRLHRLGPPGGDDSKGYAWKEIREIIDWCQTHEFWSSNILSASKLREQIVKLENQMRRDQSSGKGGKRNARTTKKERDKYEQYLKIVKSSSESEPDS